MVKNDWSNDEIKARNKKVRHHFNKFFTDAVTAMNRVNNHVAAEIMRLKQRKTARAKIKAIQKSTMVLLERIKVLGLEVMKMEDKTRFNR